MWQRGKVQGATTFAEPKLASVLNELHKMRDGSLCLGLALCLGSGPAPCLVMLLSSGSGSLAMRRQQQQQQQQKFAKLI